MSRIARSPRRPLLPALAVAAAVALSGCAAGQISQTADQVSAIDGGNGRVGQIGVLNALLANPTGSEYAKGSSAPLRLWLSNEGVQDDTLTAITTPAAGSVKISGKAVVPGQSLKDFSDESAQFTLEGLTDTITHGESVPITFKFERAGTVTINVPVQTPDQRTSGRPEIHIQPAEGSSLWESGSKESGTGEPSTGDHPGGQSSGSTGNVVVTTAGG